MSFNKVIKIDRHLIGEAQACFIAAEIGINHNGDMQLAHQMIDAAFAAGADAVKFQNYKVDDFIDDKQLTYTYNNQGKEITESQWDMFKRCELSEGQLAELKSHCDNIGLVFFSTPTSEAGVDTLVKLGTPVIKNGSDFLTHLELIRFIAKTRVPLILSTGMARVEEIDDAVNAFNDAGGKDLIVLHCTSTYPTAVSDINLRRISKLEENYKCPIGFSDHSEGTYAAAAAVALGACFIEKHFTLDKNLPGPDHYFSLDPKELKELVLSIRNMETALGDSQLGLTKSEAEAHLNFRLSCISAEDIAEGTILNRQHLVYRRPGTGIPPKYVDELLGKKLKQGITKGHIFSKDDVND